MKQKVFFLLTLIALMMLETGLAQAKGPPDRVTISSPNLTPRNHAGRPGFDWAFGNGNAGRRGKRG